MITKKLLENMIVNNPLTKNVVISPDSHVILLGGGVDSSALLSLVAKTHKVDAIKIVHIDYGQKASKAEWATCLKQCDYYGIPNSNCVQLTMDMTYAKCGIMPDTKLDTGVAGNNVLELRNPLIITFVASYLATTDPGKNHAIYVGLHKEPEDTAFKDAVAMRYITNLNRVLNSTLSNQDTVVVVRAPFKHRTRQRILQKLVSDRGAEFIRDYVHSCYEDKPCGHCTHCTWLDSQLQSKFTQG